MTEGHQKRDREDRLRLLSAIDPSVRSASTSELVASEAAALPDWDRQIPGVRAGFVHQIPLIRKDQLRVAAIETILAKIHESRAAKESSWTMTEVEGGW